MRVRLLFSLWLPVALYVGFIFWLSSAPRPIPGIRLFPWLDKGCHLAEYAPLGSLLTRALRRTFLRINWPAMGAIALALALMVAGLDEFYQSFVDTRISSAWDALFDLAGAAVGFALYRSKVARTP